MDGTKYESEKNQLVWLIHILFQRSFGCPLLSV